MEWADVFRLANMAVLPAWLYLIVGPRSYKPLNIAVQYAWPLALCLLYVGIVVPKLGSFDMSDFETLAGVRSIFASDAALTAGWVHYLAFDLFVGGWVARRADKAGLWRIAQAPILLATFAFGPLGFAVFMVVEFVQRRLWRAA